MAQDLLKRLRNLFISGRPIIRRKVKTYTPTATSITPLNAFKSAQSYLGGTFNTTALYDRQQRMADFQEMDSDPIISTALDLYAEETCSPDERGSVLNIHSENPKIHELLFDLFYKTLNIGAFLTPWVRNMCKYGDFHLFLEIHEELGIINVFPIPINEIERDERFDVNNPAAVRFKLNGSKILQDFEIAHFRLLGNDVFIPNGSSILDPARRIWRSLTLMEDAMMVYRIVRSPERRVFKIDTGNVPASEVGNLMEEAKRALKDSSIINRDNGKVDNRYGPMSVDTDYWLPVRGKDSATSIETLPGGASVQKI